MNKKSSKGGKRLAWMSKELLAKLNRSMQNVEKETGLLAGI